MVDCTGREAKLASAISFFVEERESMGYSEMSSCVADCLHPGKPKQCEWQRVLPSLGGLLCSTCVVCHCHALAVIL